MSGGRKIEITSTTVSELQKCRVKIERFKFTHNDEEYKLNMEVWIREGARSNTVIRLRPHAEEDFRVFRLFRNEIEDQVINIANKKFNYHE